MVEYGEKPCMRGITRQTKISNNQFGDIYKIGSVRTNPNVRSRIEANKHRLELAHRESEKTPEQTDIQGRKCRTARQSHIQGSTRITRTLNLTSKQQSFAPSASSCMMINNWLTFHLFMSSNAY